MHGYPRVSDWVEWGGGGGGGGRALRSSNAFFNLQYQFNVILFCFAGKDIEDEMKCNSKRGLFYTVISLRGRLP